MCCSNLATIPALSKSSLFFRRFSRLLWLPRSLETASVSHDFRRDSDPSSQDNFDGIIDELASLRSAVQHEKQCLEGSSLGPDPPGPPEIPPISPPPALKEDESAEDDAIKETDLPEEMQSSLREFQTLLSRHASHALRKAVRSLDVEMRTLLQGHHEHLVLEGINALATGAMSTGCGFNQGGDIPAVEQQLAVVAPPPEGQTPPDLEERVRVVVQRAAASEAQRQRAQCEAIVRTVGEETRRACREEVAAQGTRLLAAIRQIVATARPALDPASLRALSRSIADSVLSGALPPRSTAATPQRQPTRQPFRPPALSAISPPASARPTPAASAELTRCLSELLQMHLAGPAATERARLVQELETGALMADMGCEEVSTPGRTDTITTTTTTTTTTPGHVTTTGSLVMSTLPNPRMPVSPTGVPVDMTVVRSAIPDIPTAAGVISTNTPHPRSESGDGPVWLVRPEGRKAPADKGRAAAGKAEGDEGWRAEVRDLERRLRGELARQALHDAVQRDLQVEAHVDAFLRGPEGRRAVCAVQEARLAQAHHEWLCRLARSMASDLGRLSGAQAQQARVAEAVGGALRLLGRGIGPLCTKLRALWPALVPKLQPTLGP
ncbi:hypothetical protein PAPYR_2636 [Paratrimastix pyriformis]|uniref:Uncharacterized protein n=1 Tax=Paratrimastix pyriformis TaxID=342808 RepID=A0ABQ8UPS6_9EUKA|nr:hypothetical protein PAPYR_2636 [Paratrimastix pyriformis]